MLLPRWFHRFNPLPASICSQSRRWLVLAACLGAASLGISLANAGAPINLDVLQRDGYGMVPIKRPLPNDLIVSGNVNGRKVSLILDTGWGDDGISLSRGYISLLHLKGVAAEDHGKSASGHKMEMSRAGAGVVTMGNVRIEEVPLYFGRFDSLSDHMMRQQVGGDGFVGVGFLHTNSAIIDLQNLRLYLRPPGTGRRVLLGPALKAVGLSEIPLASYKHGHILVDAEINGANGKMLVDTGANLTGVDERFASQMKAFGYQSGISSIDAAGVTSENTLTKARTFKLGGVSVRPPEIMMSKFGFYSETGGRVIGVVGMDVLGQNWSVIDFGQQKLYLAGTR